MLPLRSDAAADPCLRVAMEPNLRSSVSRALHLACCPCSHARGPNAPTPPSGVLRGATCPPHSLVFSQNSVSRRAFLGHARHVERRILGFPRKRVDPGLAHQSDLETLDCADAPHLRLVSGWPPPWLSSRRVAAAIALALTFWLIRSFVVPLIWAAIFAIANWPLYRRCARHLPDALKARVLPLSFSVLVTFLVLGPVVFAFGILAGQSQACVDRNLDHG